MKNTIIAALLLVLSLAVPARAAQQNIAQLSAVTASREALRTSINTQLSAVQSNFDELYAAVGTRPWVIQATAPADTTLAWFDTDQVLNAVVLKIHNGSNWVPQAIGEGGSYTLPTAAADTLGGIKVGARLTITDGVLSADVQAGGESTTVGDGTTGPYLDGTVDGGTLIKLSAPSGGNGTWTSLQGGNPTANRNWRLPIDAPPAAGTTRLINVDENTQMGLVDPATFLTPTGSADLLTITDTNSRFTTDTVGAALVQIGEFNASLPNLVFGTGLTLTEDTPSAGTDTISVSANTYQAYDADWLGITPNGAALVSAANYAAMKTLLDTDDIQTLTGIAAGTAHLGTFTGTTIADSSTIKTALQSLETSVETRAPSANPVFTASAAIPQGSSPTVDAAGEIAIDLTSDQLIYYGGAKRVLTYKKQIDFAVKTPVDADDFLLFKAQTAMTITDIHVIAQGGTSISVDIQECDSAGANCATVDAAITATTTGAEDDGGFSNGTIDAGDWVKVVLGAPSGTVNYLAGSIYYVETAD